MDRALKILKSVWGYDSFRPLQEQSIRCVLDGQDSLTVLPTGGGKSVCFQVPALCTSDDSMAVVVSPLISLMQDQVDALQQCGVSAACINSMQTESEKHQIAKRIRDGDLRLLYLAPEKLLSSRTMSFLKQQSVSFFAIDEAHCVSQWGHDFRPEYRGLNVLKKEFPNCSVHAYTATASMQVRADIVRQLGLTKPETMVGDFDRPNLTYRVVRANQKIHQIMDVIRRHPGESGIVYCISRKQVEKTAAALKAHGCNVRAYHAGMDDHDRKSHQDAFMKEQCDVVVATIAFGMGIDKSNVRFVVHAGMPKSVEHYQQESGRAGRDGLESECVLLHSGSDVTTWKMILGDNKDSAQEKSLQAMDQICNSPVCRHKALVSFFGQDYEDENCGACDVCLGEINLVEDSFVTSQKIVSCVVRLKERYGISHTASVLAGAKADKILTKGHDHLSTYGLLSNQSQRTIANWIRQLIAQQYLVQQGEFKTLALTDRGRELLKGEAKPMLSSPSKSETASRCQSESSWAGVDRELFERLRELRSKLADENDTPAYTIFGDATLRQFALTRPSTLRALGELPGVGETQCNQYGKAFLDAIETLCSKNGLSRDNPAASNEFQPADSAVASFSYFRNGDSIEEVATKMARARSTVVGYLADYLRANHVSDPTPWVNPTIVERIYEQRHLAADGKLKPLFEHFDGQVSYEDIKIAMACAG